MTAILLFGIRIPAFQILPFIGFSIILLAALTGLVGLIYGVSNKRSQAQAIAPAVIIFFGMLGGAMMPIDSLPGFMQKVSRISPVYWGQDVIKKLLLDNAGIEQIGINLIVLGAIALFSCGMTFFFFERKLRT